MKLTFLGTGTSTGVPQMRCQCPTCTSTDARDKRLRASVLLEVYPDAPGVLIDCGPDFREQMLRLDSPDLACLLLTHTHYDHTGGIDDLRPYAHTAPDCHFPVYCRRDVAHDLRTRIPYSFKANPYPGVPQFALNEIEEYKPFDIVPDPRHAPVQVLPLRVMHGKLPILGFRIGNFAYITDALSLEAECIDALQGIDTLVINALRIEPHMSHQNLQECLNVINIIKPRRALLTHLSHQMGTHQQASQLLPPNVEIAFDGQVVNL